MPLLDLVIHPDPILVSETKEVVLFDETLETLSKNMFETMIHYKGVGLAAPQIGLSDRIIVVGFEDVFMVLVNPTIVEEYGSEEGVEGCLSLPGIEVSVKRAQKIRVNAQDVNGNPLDFYSEDFYARIIQHEIDHLYKTLIIDKGVPSKVK